MKNFNPNIPNNELPLLPPKADIESKRILKKALSANRELATLKGEELLLPNALLLTNPLMIKEAIESSEIENINTTIEEILEAELRDKMKETQSERKYQCPICKMKKQTSPLIHGLALMKRYTKKGVKNHIANHKKNGDEQLVMKWKLEDGDIESCLMGNKK